ncbi:OmpW family outer membrane protein [Paraburkholderia sp. BL10I2N1]|uniref:OmpW/AlkL family protein n=1 Tax=Paraburkholderia sp. BL10I2N1 TaxID=1938796 RepID=UPI00105FDFD0|nr:OmpW family outer membrane protein [Paraburkholderia sp. BL10I2N1]TDN62079.1 outer membrane protein [Paraburkholderia sp. BL10I2N1]
MRNYRRKVRSAGMAVCICSAALAGNANSQTAGSFTLATGWLHVAPQGNATPLTVESVGGIAVNKELPGTGAHATSTDTMGITTEYYVTDNIGIATLIGLPLTVNLVGEGALAKYGTLGSTRPIPPAIVLRYHLFAAQSKFRPFVGLGVNYTWFTQVRTTNSQFVTDSLGPGGSAHASLSSSWNPVFEIGANYGSFKSAVGNAAHEACGLSAEKSSLPAMRNSTVRMVLKLAYPRALRLAA